MPARFLIALVVPLAPLATAAAQPQPQPQTLDAAAFVRDLYVRYTGAEPDRAALDVWVRELRKGTSPAEVHAQVLGSGQAFEFVRKDHDAWVHMLYADILGRKPDAAGMANWQGRLRDLKFDRVKVAREFLRSAGAELAAGGGNRPGVIDPADLPEHLKATAALLSQSVASEFPGYGHFMVRTQAESFAQSVVGLQPVLRDPARFPARHREAVDALSGSLDALERSVAQSRLPAQTTRLHLEQSRQLLVAKGGGPPPIDPGGVFPADALSAADARKVRRLLDALEKDATAAEATFRAVVPRTWNTTGLLNAVTDFSAGAGELRGFARTGAKRGDLAARVQGVAASAATISDAVSRGRLDVRAVQAWYAVTASLQAVTDEVGGVVAVPPKRSIAPASP